MTIPAYDASAPHAPLRTPPLLTGSWPLVGHTVEFVRNTVGLLFRAREEQGDVAQLRLLGRRIVFVSGVAAQEAVFRARDEVLNPNDAYKMMVPVFGKGVVYDCTPDRMMEQLNMLRPALQIKRMSTYGEAISREVDASVADWGDRGILDFTEYTAVLTNYTSSRCLLGDEFREELTDEFASVYHDLERSIIPLAYIHAYLPLPVFRKRDRARKRLGELVSQIVERRRRTGHRGEDFLQTLMDSAYKDGSALSDHEITGLLIAAMFAGHHTSASTLTWCLLELLRTPDYLAEVLAELERVYPAGTPVTYESLRELVKVEAAVKETLRLHPPLFILFRTAMQDLEISGFEIKKGDWVAVSPMVGHLIEELFPNAPVFDPDRWSKARHDDRSGFAFIAFGGGRHKCLGNAFAMLQIKTILATLLRRYTFELAGDPIEPDFQGVVITPKRPCRIRYRRRDA